MYIYESAFLSLYICTHCYIYIYIYRERERERERDGERERGRERIREIEYSKNNFIVGMGLDR